MGYHGKIGISWDVIWPFHGASGTLFWRRWVSELLQRIEILGKPADSHPPDCFSMFKKHVSHAKFPNHSCSSSPVPPMPCDLCCQPPIHKPWWRIRGFLPPCYRKYGTLRYYLAPFPKTASHCKARGFPTTSWRKSRPRPRGRSGRICGQLGGHVAHGREVAAGQGPGGTQDLRLFGGVPWRQGGKDHQPSAMEEKPGISMVMKIWWELQIWNASVLAQ